MFDPRVHAKPTAPGSAALRANRFSGVGLVYLLTTATHERQRLFDRALLARIVANSLGYFARQGVVHNHAWVVMPDHVHWLFRLERGSISDAMRRMKGWTATQINRARSTPRATVWQDGFHDRVVRNPDELPTVIEYVIQNPVRWKLVTDPRQYRFLYAESEIFDPVDGSGPV